MHAAGAKGGGGLHQECAPHLPHQDPDDQAGAGKGSQLGHRELGSLPAQIPEKECEAKEGGDCEEGGVHALPPSSAAQQGRPAAGVWRVLFVSVPEGIAAGC